ncbi:MAG: PQQ-dependent sugar dehydrogenase [Candidatus Omnitrophica bacterium]|nr:PQQ-dependent sugar dehydrogenase [Candidatus Omnitrophota bacterium]
MDWKEIAKNAGCVVSLLFLVRLSLWNFRSSRTEDNRQPFLGLSIMIFALALLIPFTWMSDDLVLRPAFLVPWNILIWPSVLMGIILSTLSLMEFSEMKRPSKKGKRLAWLTLGLSVAFFVGAGAAVFSRFGVIQDGKIQFNFDLPKQVEINLEEQMQAGLLWDLDLNKKQFYSPKFHYTVDYAGTQWQPWPSLLKEYPYAEFTMKRGDDSFFIVIPVFFDATEPRQDVFMVSMMKEVGIDLNADNVGKWERQQQNGYEGFVFDFEKEAEEAEFRYRLKLLSAENYGYLILTGTQLKGEEKEKVLDRIQQNIAMDPAPKDFPDPEKFTAQEKTRHEQFFYGAGQEHGRLEEYDKAIEYYEKALEYDSRDPDVIHDIVFVNVDRGNLEAARDLLMTFQESLPNFDELMEAFQAYIENSEGEEEFEDVLAENLEGLEKTKDQEEATDEKDQGQDKEEEASEDALEDDESGSPQQKTSKDKEGRDIQEDDGGSRGPESKAKQHGTARSGKKGQAAQDKVPLPLDEIILPPDFTIKVFAERVSGAWQMAMGSQGTLFIGSRSAGVVYAAVDRDRDHVAEKVYAVAGNLKSPSGVAFKDGALFVASKGKITRYDQIESKLKNPPEGKVIRDDLPKGEFKGIKAIRFGPDERIYLSVEMPCNFCVPEDPRLGTVLRMSEDGSEEMILARGVRSVGGLAWHPRTQKLWFTDRGRDLLDRDIPRDEVNLASWEGQHFGFPYCFGNNVVDPAFAAKETCDDYTIPQRELVAHGGAAGLTFYTGSMFPMKYRDQIFIAESGIQDRSEQQGYRVSLVRFQKGDVPAYEVFASGWRRQGVAWGQPGDVLVDTDGALLVSDMLAGVVYRIVYEG